MTRTPVERTPPSAPPVPVDAAAGIVPVGLPPENLLGRRLRGELNIRIDRDGVWHYRGSPIRRKDLICLFASVLRRDEAGHFWLVTPTEIGRIEVEDAPLLAVEVFVGGSGRSQVVSLRTNVDEIISVSPDNPLRVAIHPLTGEPSPYVTVRDGIDARIVRSAFYDLVALGVERAVGDGRELGIWSNGAFFVLGPLNGDP